MPLPDQCIGDDPCPFKKRLDAGTADPGKCPECGQDSRTDATGRRLDTEPR